MHRCLIRPDDWGKAKIGLGAGEAHHLADVLRAETGDTVRVFDGHGREGLARVTIERADGEERAGRSRGRKVFLELLASPAADAPGVLTTLIQALPKGRGMDRIVEKATELGVSAVWPVMTERVVGRARGERSEARVARWRRIADSAAKQCGLNRIPEVRAVSSLEEALSACAGFDLFLAGSLAAGAAPLREVLRSAAAAPPRAVALLIGPEGDLTETELQRAAAAGATAVSFGSLVMRVETAVLYGLSALAYELR